MRTVIKTSRYRRELKKASSYAGYNEFTLNTVINNLAEGSTLDKKYKDH